MLQNEAQLKENLQRQQEILKWMQRRNCHSITIQDVQRFEAQVVRLQSIIRGYQVWKKHTVRAPEGAFDETIDINALLHNQVVKRVRAEAGDFDYSKCKASALRLCPETADHLVKREPFRILDGPVYIGEWSSDFKQRAGQGVLIWADGSVHEGQWARNMAVGYGRLIDAEGNLYEGEWLQDQSHGTGVFQGIDGSTYRGQF